MGRAFAVLGTLTALALPALGAETPPSAKKSTKQGATPGGKPAPVALSPMPKIPPYTKLQYDSMLSVNEQCPVRHGHLNPGIRPMYVNRQPVGFC
jgi:hypothetical protein